MSTSLVYVLPSIMFGQMLAARKATHPQTSNQASPRESTRALPPTLTLTRALPRPYSCPPPPQDKSRAAQLELLGSRCITLLGVFMVAVGMKAAF